MEPAEIPIARIMHRDYEHVAPGTTLAEVLEKFSVRGRHDLIVLEEDGTFVGVIMITDVAGCLMPHLGVRPGRRMVGMPSRLLCMLRGSGQGVGELVTRIHLTIPPDATVGEALVHMVRDQHPYLVVVDDAGKAVGCVELADIIGTLLESGHL
jgi:CBS-domain-containing membrane protein